MSVALGAGLLSLTVLAFFVVGWPVSFAMLATSIIWFVIFQGPGGLASIPLVLFADGSQDLYLSVPAYVLMGMALQESGIGRDMFDTFHVWSGRMGGGLAIATVLACTVLAAMTGLGATGVLLVGTIALPEMLRRGYNKRFALGCIPPSGALGPLIPPSIVMIMVGGLTGISIGALFMAGIVPGLVLSGLYCAYIWIRCRMDPSLGPGAPPSERLSLRQKLAATSKIALPALIILAVLGSIYTGSATPTEAGAVGAVLVLAVSLAMRRLNLSKIREVAYRSLALTTMVMWLLITGDAFGNVLVRSGASSVFSSWFLGLQGGPGAMLFAMLLATFVAGMFVEGPVIVIILTPLFFRVVTQAGIDPLFFGILYTIALISGYITPPVGNNLFYTQALVKHLERSSEETKKYGMTMADIYWGVVPYNVIMVVVMLLIVFFPGAFLWPAR